MTRWPRWFLLIAAGVLTLGATGVQADEATDHARGLADNFRGALLAQAVPAAPDVPPILLAQTQPGTPAAQEDPWRLTFTPQFWFSYIPPLVSTASLGVSGATVTKQIEADREPPIFLQSGGSVALGKGPWTFAIGILFVEYAMLETNTLSPGFVYIDQVRRNLGSTATIRWDVLRTDTDVAATYAFLDVVPNFLDVSVGVGGKWIHISTERTIQSPSGAFFGSTRTNTVTVNEDILAATLPIGLNMHLSENWFVPVTVTPLYGASTNKTEGVYGGTADIGLRYRFSNGVSFFGGYRGQYISGGPTGEYGAHGPIISLSVPVTF